MEKAILYNKRGMSGHVGKGKDTMKYIFIFLIVALFAISVAPSVLNSANNTSGYYNASGSSIAGVPVWQYTVVGLVIVAGLIFAVFKLVD